MNEEYGPFNQFRFVRRGSSDCKAQDSTLGVRFAQKRIILDDWHLFGWTKWSRTVFRLKHPIIYSKRGLRNLWRKIRRMIWGHPPMILCRKWVTKEEALKDFPDKERKNGNNQKQTSTTQ